MRQIFVSYARSDEIFARRLVDDLALSGANVWLDIRDARPGRYWTRSIEQALGESSMMMVVLSPTALDSVSVAAEWQAYLEAYRPVIPVLARPCAPPGPLRTRRPIDFTREQNYSRAFHQLVTRLIECSTRVRRSEPVIWTAVEQVEAREPRPLPPREYIPLGPQDDSLVGAIRRMVQGLREALRRGASAT